MGLSTAAGAPRNQTSSRSWACWVRNTVKKCIWGCFYFNFYFGIKKKMLTLEEEENHWREERFWNKMIKCTGCLSERFNSVVSLISAERSRKEERKYWLTFLVDFLKELSYFKHPCIDISLEFYYIHIIYLLRHICTQIHILFLERDKVLNNLSPTDDEV